MPKKVWCCFCFPLNTTKGSFRNPKKSLGSPSKHGSVTGNFGARFQLTAAASRLAKQLRCRRLRTQLWLAGPATHGWGGFGGRPVDGCESRSRHFKTMVEARRVVRANVGESNQVPGFLRWCASLPPPPPKGPLLEVHDTSPAKFGLHLVLPWLASSTF